MAKIEAFQFTSHVANDKSLLYILSYGIDIFIAKQFLLLLFNKYILKSAVNCRKERRNCCYFGHFFQFVKKYGWYPDFVSI